MWRLPISKDMSIEQTIELMAENNSLARSILYKCATEDPRLLLCLDDMNLRGVQVVYAFDSFCQRKPVKFKACVRTRSKEMVDCVNKLIEPMNIVGYNQRAVTRGGAPR